MTKKLKPWPAIVRLRETRRAFIGQAIDGRVRIGFMLEGESCFRMRQFPAGAIDVRAFLVKTLTEFNQAAEQVVTHGMRGINNQ